MKCKFINWLTVCFITFVVLSPELAVLGAVWEDHLNLTNTQHLVAETKQTTVNTNSFDLTESSTKLYQEPAIAKVSDLDILWQKVTLAHQYRILNLLQWLLLIFPIGLCLGIILYDKYLAYRAAVLQEQIEMLERLWQQNFEY